MSANKEITCHLKWQFDGLMVLGVTSLCELPKQVMPLRHCSLESVLPKWGTWVRGRGKVALGSGESPSAWRKHVVPTAWSLTWGPPPTFIPRVESKWSEWLTSFLESNLETKAFLKKHPIRSGSAGYSRDHMSPCVFETATECWAMPSETKSQSWFFMYLKTPRSTIYSPVCNYSLKHCVLAFARVGEPLHLILKGVGI